jgi:hypothetical protein
VDIILLSMQFSMQLSILFLFLIELVSIAFTLPIVDPGRYEASILQKRMVGTSGAGPSHGSSHAESNHAGSSRAMLSSHSLRNEEPQESSHSLHSEDPHIQSHHHYSEEAGKQMVKAKAIVGSHKGWSREVNKMLVKFAKKTPNEARKVKVAAKELVAPRRPVSDRAKSAGKMVLHTMGIGGSALNTGLFIAPGALVHHAGSYASIPFHAAPNLFKAGRYKALAAASKKKASFQAKRQNGPGEQENNSVPNARPDEQETPLSKRAITSGSANTSQNKQLPLQRQSRSRSLDKTLSRHASKQFGKAKSIAKTHLEVAQLGNHIAGKSAKDLVTHAKDFLAARQNYAYLRGMPHMRDLAASTMVSHAVDTIGPGLHTGLVVPPAFVLGHVGNALALPLHAAPNLLAAALVGVPLGVGLIANGPAFVGNQLVHSPVTLGHYFMDFRTFRRILILSRNVLEAFARKWKVH